jgi:hypothetical protein
MTQGEITIQDVQVRSYTCGIGVGEGLFVQVTYAPLGMVMICMDEQTVEGAVARCLAVINRAVGEQNRLGGMR